MKKWTWLWWVLGIGGAGAAAYFVFRPGVHANTTPCVLPSGLSPSDLHSLQMYGVVQWQPCMADMQAFLNYYGTHRRPDGSVVSPNGHVFANLDAALAAAAV